MGCDLYHRCASGDEKAWEYLYGYVLSVARWARWGLDDAAEDIAQSVVLRLLDNGLSKVKRPAHFRRYARTMTINSIMDFYRDRAFYVDALHEDFPTREPAPEKRIELKEIAKQARTLPSIYQSAFEAFVAYKAGLLESYKEIAELLGRPVNTVSVQIKRALEKIREMRA